MTSSQKNDERRQRIRVLRFLGAAGAERHPVDTEGRELLLSCRQGEEKRLAVEAALLERMLGDDLLTSACDGDIGVSAVGKAWLRRAMSAGDEAFRHQHGSIERRQIAGEAGEKLTVTVDDAESPLSWLYRRRGRDGSRLLDEAQYSAGERLRADYTKGQLLPRITANWSADVNQGRRRSGEAGGVADLTDAALAARARVRAALDATGPELSGVLVDVCCFLKGLEDVERERRWPVRSAKIILSLALRRLARHYGYTAGAACARSQVLGWGVDGYRPSLSPGDG